MTASAIRRERISIAGAFIGNALEWFDFFVFGTAAALVFGRVFFPEVDSGTALIASFATFWVGFLTRPLGAIVFGHFGDRHGRKNVLLATLLLMGASTMLIGVLPGYAQIGIFAPILLTVLRAFQGLAVGGEWGGAVLVATENATDKRKTVAGAWVQQGSPVGSLLATGSFALVGLLPDDEFYAWGWRLPFLASAVLVIVGIVLRLRLQESPEFLASRTADRVEEMPLVGLFRRTPKIVLASVAAVCYAVALAYFTNTFLLAWTTSSLGIERQTMLNVLVGMAFVQFVFQMVAGQLAQRFGRTRILLIGLGLTLVFAVPFFAAIGSANVPFITIMLYLTAAAASFYFAVLASFLAYAFPPELRYSGVSVSYNLGSSLIGGGTPLIAQWILQTSGGSAWAVCAFYAALIVVTTSGVIGLHRLAGKPTVAVTAETAGLTH